MDIESSPAIDVFALDGAAYKQTLKGGTGGVTLDAPVPVTIDLDALVL